MMVTSALISSEKPVRIIAHSRIGRVEVSPTRNSVISVSSNDMTKAKSAAVTAALQAKEIAGVGFDVLPQEPPASGEALLATENVVLSPHVAWYSEDSIVDLQASIGRNVAAVCAGRKPGAIVNPEVLEKVNLV